MSPMRAHSRQGGFTLVELLVVLAVFAVFAVLAYGGLIYVLRSRTELKTVGDRLANVQRAYVRVRNDLQQISPRGSRNSFGTQSPPLEYENFTGSLRYLWAGWRNPLLQPRAALTRVQLRYDFENKRWLRELMGAADPSTDKPLYSSPLLDKVDAVRWRFMVNGEWRNELPIPASPTAFGPPTALPSGLEVTIETPDLGNLRWVFLPATGGVTAAQWSATLSGGDSSGSSSGTSSSSRGTGEP